MSFGVTSDHRCFSLSESTLHVVLRLGSSVGVEIAEETSRSRELSCAGMTLAVFQHGRVEKFKKVYFKKTPKGRWGTCPQR